MQRAVVEDELAGIGELRELFRDRPRVAGPDQAAAQAQAEAGVGPVVARREHLQPHAVVPEVVADRHQLERIPEIRAALGDHVRVRGDALLQQRHQRRRHVQRHAAAQRVVQ